MKQLLNKNAKANQNSVKLLEIKELAYIIKKVDALL
jgi:ribosomal protein S6